MTYDLSLSKLGISQTGLCFAAPHVGVQFSEPRVRECSSLLAWGLNST